MSVHVRLSQFEGPLDLLLHLIHNAQISIADIFVSEITAQYIEMVSGMDTLDMETASEFIAMAATLLYIKSRSLLPRPKAEPEEEEDPETLLIRQLQAYETCKEIAAKLSERLQGGRSYGKLPDEIVTSAPGALWEETSVQALFEAFAEAMLRDKTPPPPPAPREVVKDAYPITERIAYLQSLLASGKSVRFSEVLRASHNRMERVSTFMAILEMLSAGQVWVRQESAFEDIFIERTPALEKALVSVQEDFGGIVFGHEGGK